MTFGQDDKVIKELQAQTEAYLSEEEQKMEQAIRWLSITALLYLSYALTYRQIYKIFASFFAENLKQRREKSLEN